MNYKLLGGFLRKKGIIFLLHIAIMILSVFLITIISIDTFRNEAFYTRPQFQKEQFWICLVFMLDFFIEWILSEKKWHYLKTHFIFFLVSIPYQALVYKFGAHYGWQLSDEVAYIIRYMPLIRGGYALAIVVSWFTYNKASGLFFTYLITLFSTVYFASLTFFLFEYKVNPLVHSYQDALWWAFMDVTTVGSNIVAVTGVGRILSVLLASLGMMMFPIFTVYVTNVITARSKQANDNNSGLRIIDAYRSYVKSHTDNKTEEPVTDDSQS